VALGGIGIPTVFGWLVRVFDQASNLVLRGCASSRCTTSNTPPPLATSSTSSRSPG
jgi:hypothetical protein